MTRPDDWSPALYLTFEDERTRPARELLARVPASVRGGAPRRIVDVGTGPGNSAAVLAERFPEAALFAFDHSPAMVATAERELARFGTRVSVGCADATEWRPDPEVDLVFSNATYQWVPDTLGVLTDVFRALAPGACLAVQMPDNLAEPTHRAMREVGSDERFRAPLTSAARPPLASLESYNDALAPHARSVDLWQTTYAHVLDDAASIVRWVESTGLRPYLSALDPSLRPAFLERYTSAIAEAYPPRADGRVLLRFPRRFVVATRA